MFAPDDLSKITDVIVRTVPTEKIYLFGSYAHGTQSDESDYDIYIVISNDSIRPLDAIGNVYLAMRGIRRRPVDILAGTADVFRRRSEQATLERKIAREGVVLYERNPQRRHP